MKLALLGILVLFTQDDVAARLKKEGWRAVHDLLDKGEDARAALEKTAAGRDPDAAFYAGAALGELDCRRGGEFGPVARTRSAGGSAAAVVGGLFKAAGLESILDDLPAKPLTLPDNLTFAEAIEEATRALNVEFVQAENGAWKVIGPPVKAPRFASGRTRAIVTEITHGTYWRPGLPPQCLYWLGVRMDGFGRFRQAPLYVDLRVIEAVDEHGRDLVPKRDWHEESVERRDAKDKERRATMTVSLEAPDLKTTKVARLRLAVDFAFRKKDGVITFENLEGATNVKKKVGDVEATLLRAGQDDDRFHVELKLKGPGIDSRLSKDEEDFGEKLVAHLLDSTGKGWEEGGGGSGSDGREFSFQRDYRNPGNVGPPATFSFTMVTEVETRSVTLELRDVPLR